MCLQRKKDGKSKVPSREFRLFDSEAVIIVSSKP